MVRFEVPSPSPSPSPSPLRTLSGSRKRSYDEFAVASIEESEVVPLVAAASVQEDTIVQPGGGLNMVERVYQWYISIEPRARQLIRRLFETFDEAMTRPRKRVRVEYPGVPCSWPLGLSPSPPPPTAPPASAPALDHDFLKSRFTKVKGYRLVSPKRAARQEATVARASRDLSGLKASRRDAQFELQLAGRQSELSPVVEDVEEEAKYFVGNPTNGSPIPRWYKKYEDGNAHTTKRDNAMAVETSQKSTVQQSQDEQVTAQNFTSTTTTTITKTSTEVKQQHKKPRSPMSPLVPLPVGRWAAYALADRTRKQQAKDDKINKLLQRAKQAQVESPEAASARLALRQKKEREEKARLEQKEREEQAEKEKKVATAAAKAKIEQERRLNIKAQQDRARGAGVKKPRSRASSRQPSQERLDDTAAKLIAPLQAEWAAKVDALMNNSGDPDMEIAHATNNVPLLLKTFQRILGNAHDGSSGWLDDDAVNAFLHALVDAMNKNAGYTKSSGKVPPYAAFNSAWWSTYKRGGIQGIKSWSKRQGIQGQRLEQAKGIFFPINTGAHWTLMFIDPTKKSINFFDSLEPTGHNHNHGHSEIVAIRSWLEQELGKAYRDKEWSRSRYRSKRQDNGSDCGVFTCFNALAAARSIDYKAVSAEKMNNARRQLAAILLNGGFKGDFQIPS